MREKRQRRAGAALVEFAIVASVFFLLILGIIELGRGFMVKHQLNDAASVGARVGILPGKSTNDIATVVAAKLSQVGITAQTVTVQVNGSAANASSAVADDEINVIITVPAENVTWLPGGKYLVGTLRAECTMRRE